jgi:isoamylase
MDESRRDRPPLGACVSETGTHFAVFSDHADRIDLCLFDDADTEVARLPLPERSGGVHQGFVSGIGPGARYGYRAVGPTDRKAGHRFNPAKLLVDPYARALAGALVHDAALFDANDADSAAFVPKAVVTADDDGFDWGGDAPPATPFSDTVIYEAHVRSLTMRHPAIPEALRGTYEALGHPAIIDHLTTLGITALQLLPVHAFIDDRFLIERGLRNHWGYNTLGFFAPEARYAGPAGAKGLKSAVKALHAAGIEVILDVVYNHTAESDDTGPTLSFRGLDNVSYYRRAPDGSAVNDTGCGNTVRCDHPMVMRLILDSLRDWVRHYHVDGFRFDLATVLGRTDEGGFDPDAPLLNAIVHDPILSSVKLIAEPWDIGPDGYQLGAFQPGFAEWNDRFRDDVRMFWRGDDGTAPALAQRLLGSADIFDRNGRAPWASINNVTTHDGFTLSDLVSYAEKHNTANGEGNRDGHDANHSSNGGVEGPTDDPAIVAARTKRRRNLAATLLLSQGVPMLLSGDEIGHTQTGNNNAYCQDNETTWLDWTDADADFSAFVADLIRFRAEHPALRQNWFLHGRPRCDGLADVSWSAFDGGPPDWNGPDARAFAVVLREAADAPQPSQGADAVLIAINGTRQDKRLSLPEPGSWRRALSTAQADAAEVLADSIAVFVAEREGAP